MRSQSDRDEFRLDIFADTEALGRADLFASAQLAGNENIELMFASGNVAGVDPLHTALLQRFELLEAVDVMRNRNAIDLELHRIEAKAFSLRERHEDGDLGVGWIEKLLLETVELRSNAKYIRFDLLNLLVQALHLLLRDGFRSGGSGVDTAHQGECNQAGDSATERNRGALP